MDQNIEIEFKNLLTEKEYMDLFKGLNLKTQNIFSQENIYFDTINFDLKKKKLALRIRIKNTHAEITLKSPHKEHLLETNIAISLLEAQQIIKSNAYYTSDSIADILRSYGLDTNIPLKIFANLRTERIEQKNNNSIIVLDKNYYANQVDYELEVESSSAEEGNQLIDDLMKNYEIPKRKTPNKIMRAFNAIHSKDTEV
ncbi:hypothetical protein BKP56_07570 [Marinilactibacillus sp. 15R]|uniref:Uncharacterized protein YjbK n=1 Tax=Marinilactibacillus piezotolerans TaxID=258723 RepID=A0A1I3ZKZ2_9LACT|nr:MULTISPECIES: CYTH domain-containing protein [Marinilactibacillus]API89120.1 hypothetical protein BKP56_07570 [Marinilactibacillus sp. 15R]SFK44610.1 Uncharacterized protein YjbK [Marinilactibacillus piezotolerans]